MEKPVWGSRHDEVVSRFKKAREQGKIKEFVIAPRE